MLSRPSLHQNTARRLLVPCLLLSACAATAIEQTLVFQQGLNDYDGCQDNSIYEESQNTAGGANLIFSGTTSMGDIRRALLRFDLAEISPDATIVSATLEIVVKRVSPVASGETQFRLHALTRAWGEGTVTGVSPAGTGGTALEGDATWLSSRHNLELWTNPGGDFLLESSGTAPAGPPEVTTVTWTSTTLRDDVSGWISNPASNAGWIIICEQESTDGSAHAFASSEATTLAQRPKLTVVIETGGTTPEDIDGQNGVNAVDVQLAINGALDLDITGFNADVNNDSVVNAVDVQLVINAALGL